MDRGTRQAVGAYVGLVIAYFFVDAMTANTGAYATATPNSLIELLVMPVVGIPALLVSNLPYALLVIAGGFAGYMVASKKAVVTGKSVDALVEGNMRPGRHNMHTMDWRELEGGAAHRRSQEAMEWEHGSRGHMRSKHKHTVACTLRRGFGMKAKCR